MTLSSATQNVSAVLAAKPELSRLKKATDAFEAQFIKQVLSTARKSVGETKWGESLGGDTFKEMYDQEVATKVSQSGIGIGQVLFDSISPGVIRDAAAKISRQQAAGEQPVNGNDAAAQPAAAQDQSQSTELGNMK